MAVKATKSSHITERLNVLSDQEVQSEFEIFSIKRDIDQLLKVDAAVHYMLLGMFYSVTGNEAASIENHEKSLKLTSEPVYIMNYGLSLRRLGKTAESLDMILQAYNKEPHSTDSVMEVFTAMFCSGDVSRFDEVCERFMRASPTSSLDDFEDARKINKIKLDLARAGVPESEFPIAMQLVQNAVFGLGYRTESVATVLNSFDGVSHLSVEIGFNVKSGRELAALSETIADAVVSDERITAWDRLIFTAVLNHEVEDRARAV